LSFERACLQAPWKNGPPLRFVIPSEARDLQLSGEKRYYVYIMASRSLNLYAGVTNSIYQRALQHKSGEVDGFTKRYHINRLVYYESFKYVGNAIAREKQIKGWSRAKKLELIKSMNPTWQDLAEGWGETIDPLKLQIPRSARDDKPDKDALSDKEGLSDKPQGSKANDQRLRTND
jgi:putative endonuclease